MRQVDSTPGSAGVESLLVHGCVLDLATTLSAHTGIDLGW